MIALPAPTPGEIVGADESEIALVASVLLNPESAALAVSLVEVEDLRSARCAELWGAIAAVHETGALPDAPLVVDHLARAGTLDRAGGRQGILDLVESFRGHAGANTRHYALVVREAAGSRRIARLADDLARRAKAGEAPLVLTEAWEETIRDLRVGPDERGGFIKRALLETYREIGASVTGAYVPTGYPALDDALLGWEGGQLILIGGRPSMGKTAFALNLAANAASQQIPVAFFSLEMTDRELIRRLLSWASGVSFSKVRKRGWIPTDEEHAALTSAANMLCEMPLWVDDTPGLGLAALRTKVRRLVDRGVKAIFVDYLGLMSPPKSRTITNRENEIGAISRGLKRLAKEFDVPILALQQLNREAAKSNEADAIKGKAPAPPSLTDLRDSGSLEQDADVVLFVHRDAYYTKDRFDHTAKIVIRKQRNGECCDVTLAWSGDVQTFTTMEPPK